MGFFRQYEKLSTIISIIILFIFPFIVPQGFVSVGFIALQYALFGLGLNIVVGWTGLLDLGSAGFVAVGAYTAAICLTLFSLPMWIVLPLTFIVGFLSGILLGIPTLRHRSDYFAILTLGFAELISLAIRNWPSVTGGAYGYSGIPALKLPFMSASLMTVPPIGYYYIVLILIIPTYILLNRLRETKLGMQFQVIKESEVVAQAYGINVVAVKTFAFGLSAAIISVGGFFWASYQRSIVWTEFDVPLSCMLLSILIIGGLGNTRGVVIGGVIIGSASEILRILLTAMGLPQNMRFFVFAVLLLLFINMRPFGIFSDKPSWLRKGGKAKKTKEGRCRARVDVATESNKDLLICNAITKKFDGVVALDNITFTVERGDCIALIGPNGAGKTTLLNLINGFQKITNGDIYVNNVRLNNLLPFRIARLGIGRSFQDICVFDDLTIEDNLLLLSRNSMPDDIQTVLTQFGYQDGTVVCSLLSYGEKKILDFARLFTSACYFELLLLDEPTAGLSIGESERLVKIINSLRTKYSLTIIIVSHDMFFLDTMQVDKVFVLNNGKLFAEGSFSEIRNDKNVKRVFWGDEV